MKPTYQLLKVARDVVKNMPRLPKGSFSDGAGSFCTLGALQHVERDGKFDIKTMSHARHLLGRSLPASYGPYHSEIPLFNDAALTTKDDVVDLFTKAMRAAR